jgi:hypothetical protein
VDHQETLSDDHQNQARNHRAVCSVLNLPVFYVSIIYSLGFAHIICPFSSFICMAYRSTCPDLCKSYFQSRGFHEFWHNGLTQCRTKAGSSSGIHNVLLHFGNILRGRDFAFLSVTTQIFLLYYSAKELLFDYSTNVLYLCVLQHK